MIRFLYLASAFTTAMVVVAACSPPAAEVASSSCRHDPEVESQTAEALRLHVEAHLAADPVGAASLYTDDVWFRWDGGLDRRTRATMEDVYREAYTSVRYVDIGFTSDELIVCGDAAHEVGHFYETVEVDGQRSTSRHHYMVLWRLQPDGSWKVSRGAGSALPEGS